MGRLTDLTAELAPCTMQVGGTIDIIRRTVEALAGASELPVSRVHVPAGGGKAFEFPGETPDAPEYVPSFTGIVLSASFINARWDHEYGEAGADKTPRCMSRDGLSGYDTDGMEHACRACPWNRMGSRDGGRGKACRNMVQLLVMAEGEPLPIALKVPTMSVANWAQYVARVLSPRGLQPWQVATRFSLMKATSGGGIEYSQIMFQCAGRVADEDIAPLMGALSPMLPGTEAEALEGVQ
ncbi:MAG: hypothetical protein IJ048_03745 [Clostridia bacterium]|nr:hypothetical protein [Clostridia bacterium]